MLCFSEHQEAPGRITAVMSAIKDPARFEPWELKVSSAFQMCVVLAPTGTRLPTHAYFYAAVAHGEMRLDVAARSSAGERPTRAPEFREARGSLSTPRCWHCSSPPHQHTHAPALAPAGARGHKSFGCMPLRTSKWCAIST